MKYIQYTDTDLKMNKLRYVIVDSHRNMTAKRKESLKTFFSEIKNINDEAAQDQVGFCDWFERENAVKWFETIVYDGSVVAGYLRCMRNPKDGTQWFIGEVHVRKEYRGNGIATRMYEKTIDTVMEFEAAQTLIASVHPKNINSVGLHKKMGFKDTKRACKFPNLWFDENETEYRKVLYKFMPVPAGDLAVEKLMPLWLKYTVSKEKEADEKAEGKKLLKILKDAEKGKCLFESIWCGNRLKGFRYDIGNGEKTYGI